MASPSRASTDSSSFLYSPHSTNSRYSFSSVGNEDEPVQTTADCREAVLKALQVEGQSGVDTAEKILSKAIDDGVFSFMNSPLGTSYLTWASPERDLEMIRSMISFTKKELAKKLVNEPTELPVSPSIPALQDTTQKA